MNPVSDLILKEGVRATVSAFAAALALALLGFECLATVALLAGLLIAWNYRRPVRGTLSFEKGAVIAPCDGKITAIETLSDGRIRVEIVSGWLDTSLLCMPFAGEIAAYHILHGARLGRKSPLAEALNEQAWLRMKNSQERTLEIVHLATMTPAPLLIDAVERSVEVGTRYGIHTHGMSRIYFPATSRVAVNSGDCVKGGESLLGYLV